VCGGQSIHPNVHVGQQDFQAGRDAGESEARRDVRGGGRLFLFPDPLGLHNPGRPSPHDKSVMDFVTEAIEEKLARKRGAQARHE